MMMGIMMAAAAQIMANADLQAAAERFAGRALLVDNRLALPACAAPDFAWAGLLVEARCAAPAWRVFLAQGNSKAVPGVVYAALAAEVSGPPRYRRGERVVVRLAGAGFDVRLEALADGEVKDGRLWVKPVAGDGRRLRVRVEADGQLAIDGLSTMVGGR
jgi:hypothetical protein